MKIRKTYLDTLFTLWQQESCSCKLFGIIYLSAIQREAILKTLLRPYDS